MSLLTKLLDNEKNTAKAKKIEKELPYFMTFVTLLATSGFGPYTIFQKLKDITLLPESRNESEKILKRIDLLGLDPLTAMTKVKEKSHAKEFAEFLGGYVSAIQGGGDIVSYLSSKMKSAFERYAEIEKQSIEKVQTIIETYMTMQVVVLAVYIIMNSMSNPASTDLTQSGTGLSDLFVAFPPLISLLFLFIAKSIHKSKIKEIEMKKIIMIGAPAVGASFLIILLGIIPKFDPIILGAALIVASIWPMLKFRKIYKLNLDATSASPSILRDIAETRKAGIGPEKCVIKACKRKDFGSFNDISSTIASRLEWGNSLSDIYKQLKTEVENFHVLVNFKILFEIISAGGGNVHTLESLAETAEKMYNVEKQKLDMLKPYVMIGFMMVGLTSFITLLVIDSMSSINIDTAVEEEAIKAIQQKRDSDIRVFSYAILLQSWLAGLFIGKITTGSYSGGFLYAVLLVVIAMIGVIAVLAGIFDISSVLGGGQTGGGFNLGFG